MLADGRVREPIRMAQTSAPGNSPSSFAAGSSPLPEMNRESLQVVATAFIVLFCIVGMALWGLPFYYDFMIEQFGWTRAQVISGNAVSKLVVGPLFGFIAGWMVDRFGPRRLMMAGIVMAGFLALIGMGLLGAAAAAALPESRNLDERATHSATGGRQGDRPVSRSLAIASRDDSLQPRDRAWRSVSVRMAAGMRRNQNRQPHRRSADGRMGWHGGRKTQ